MITAILDRLETSAELWEHRLTKLLGKSRVLGSYATTSPERLREIATQRGVHHVSNAINLSTG